MKYRRPWTRTADVPFRPREYHAPSTIADVIGQIVDAFGDMADATPIMVGKQFLERGVGSAPRVVFVPEPRGKVGAASKLGRPASVEHSCAVYVRAPEEGSDVERFKAAHLLGDRVIDCIATAGAGRIIWGEYSDGSPVDVDAYGAEVVLTFTYKRDVLHDAARWALPAPAEDTSDPTPHVPPGIPADDVELDITTAPEE